MVIAARDRPRVESAAAEIASLTGNSVEADTVDIRDRESVEALAGRHRVDILVNNAGGQFPQKARDFSPNGWRSVIDLNLNGTWAMTQVFGNQMLDGGGGSIVQIVAIVGRGLPGIARHGGRSGRRRRVESHAGVEWGRRCGVVASRRARSAPMAGSRPTTRTSATCRASRCRTPAVRATSPTPPSSSASPAADFVTGQCLYVDGGHVLHGLISALPDSSYPERER